MAEGFSRRMHVREVDVRSSVSGNIQRKIRMGIGVNEYSKHNVVMTIALAERSSFS